MVRKAWITVAASSPVAAGLPAGGCLSGSCLTFERTNSEWLENTSKSLLDNSVVIATPLAGVCTSLGKRAIRPPDAGRHEDIETGAQKESSPVHAGFRRRHRQA